jgi:hypothetical protein
MARIRKALPQRLDVSHLISAGVLASVCPRELIDQALSDHCRHSQRQRLLPAPAVVYYVMALALWREAPQEEVLRIVCESLHWLSSGRQAQPEQIELPSKGSISKARSRLGAPVMKQLARQVLRPLADQRTRGAWWRQWRLMAIDGTSLDVADEQANASYFGYPGSSRGQSAFPQMRVLGLVECGTHVVTAAELAPCKQGEQRMAEQMLTHGLRSDMLVLADRGFYSFKLWRQARMSAGALLWRVKTTLKLPVRQRLPDGSYLSEVYDSGDRQRRHGQTVRVIEYQLTGAASAPQDSYRLITNLLEHEQAPAQELAALYHQRWEIEGVFDEIKTHLRGARTVLRSKTPELVRQEMWGLLMAHFAVRQLMVQAARQQDQDPDELSFMHALRVIKRKLPQAAAIPP